MPSLSETLLPAESGDVLEFRGLQGEPTLDVDRALSANPSGRRLLRVRSRGAKRARIRPDDCRRRDFWLACDEAFPRRIHRLGGKGEGETGHVECSNRTLRQRPGCFVRRTLSFSKGERAHQIAARLFVHYDDFSLALQPLSG